MSERKSTSGSRWKGNSPTKKSVKKNRKIVQDKRKEKVDSVVSFFKMNDRRKDIKNLILTLVDNELEERFYRTDGILKNLISNFNENKRSIYDLVQRRLDRLSLKELQDIDTYIQSFEKK